MLRRTLLAVSAAFSAGAAFAADKVGIRPETVPSSAEYPRLRAGTQLDHLYESMLANGFGIKNPKASSDLPTVVIVLIRNVLGAHVFGMQRCRSPTRLTLSGIWFPF